MSIIPHKLHLPRKYTEDIEAAFNECLRRGYITEARGCILHYQITSDDRGRTRVAIWHEWMDTGEVAGGVALVDPLDLLAAVPQRVLNGLEA